MPRIAGIDLYSVAYPFHGSFKFFTSAPGLPPGRRTVVVRLRADDGSDGWGQAVPSPRWSYETPETVRSTLERYLAPALLGVDVDDAPENHSRLHRAIAPSFSVGQPIAKAALDLALWDLRGKLRKQSVTRMWRGVDAVRPVVLSWTLNPTTLDDVPPAVDEARRRGYRHFNVKVAPNLEFDLAVLRAVRELAPDAFLWVDANGGYDLASALAAAPAFAELGVAALEQPLPANALDDYRVLRRRRDLPILLDESIVSTADFDTFHKLELLDGVAMKVARMGGLTEACRLVDRLRDTGLLFFASGLTDPDLSLAASLQLFSGGDLRFPAALNGPQFLHGSVLTSPLTPQGDLLAPPPGPGLGVEVDPAALIALSEDRDRE